MVDKLDEMEDKLNEQIERNVALNRRLSESTADVIFADVTEGLADTQKKNSLLLPKMLSLKVSQTIVKKYNFKESYFPQNTGAQKAPLKIYLKRYQLTSFCITVSSTMESYLNTLLVELSKK